MSKNDSLLNITNRTLGWLTIHEAVNLINKTTEEKIKTSDIYRHILCGSLSLSIYFQSPIILQRVQMSKNKIKLKPTNSSLIERLCLLEKRCFIGNRNLIVSTEGKYIYPLQRVIDTSLVGYEYFLVQRLLANALNIPGPVERADDVNYGISVLIAGELFQTFQKTTWQERIKQQTMNLPKDIAQTVDDCISSQQKSQQKCNQRAYFPIHALPQDACFVVRHSELEKLIDIPIKSKRLTSTPTRISTPLSRMFWLACKHNKEISPLISQPYKLLSIFEQWAITDGMTDRLSGDTLKTALKRGSPTSV